MEWKLLKREIKTVNGIELVDTDEQVDSVGNIYQKSGAVIPKRCQKCKSLFAATIETVPITQNVPYYSCADCSFKNASGDMALDHKIQNIEHNIEKKSKQRIVSYEKRLFGRLSYITKTDDDCLILCSNCSHGVNIN